MSKHAAKGQRKKRAPRTVHATVEYVSFRTVRFVGEDGQRYALPAADCIGLFPGDRIVGQLGWQRGRLSLNPRFHSIEHCDKDHQIVLQVHRLHGSGTDGVILEPLAFAIPELIQDCSALADIQDGTFVQATVTRQAVRKGTVSRWKVTKPDQVLLGNGEVACAIAYARFGIRNHWSSEFQWNIDEGCNAASELQRKDRRDLTGLPFVTIDPATARDHDDAVFCEPGDAGGFRLYVAIADVAEYVQSDTELDGRAMQNGASIYCLDQAAPMLPPQLSNDLCSLKLRTDRLALVCEMTVSDRGKVSDYVFYEAKICSQARLSYDKVDTFRQSGKVVDLPRKITTNLQHLFEVYTAFCHARTNRGVLTLDLSGVNFEYSKTGDVHAINRSAQFSSSHGLVEEAMLAANACAAKFLAKHYPVAAMYRIHDNPASDGLDEINGLLAYFDIHHVLTPESAAADYQSIVDALNCRYPEASSALQMHLLRSIATAVYSSEQRPHFALNYSEYTHFTSPIRRYPDLVVHRLIKQVLRGEVHPSDVKQLTTIALHSSARERRAESCAREAEKWIKAEFMKSHIGEVFEGIIVDVKKFGIFVQLNSPFVDGMVSVADLGHEYFDYDKRAKTTVGTRTGRQFEIGQTLKVMVVGADAELGHVNFELM